MHSTMAFKFKLLGCTPSFEASMCQISNFLSEKVTLQQLWFQIMLSKLVKKLHVSGGDVLQQCGKDDDYVIKVDEAVYQIQLP